MSQPPPIDGSSTASGHRWQQLPVSRWENEDVVDWADAVGLDELSDALHGQYDFLDYSVFYNDIFLDIKSEMDLCLIALALF